MEKTEKKSREYLLNIFTSERRHAWIGTRPPFEMEPIDMLNSTNYRVSPKLHHNFDVVWIYEHLLSDINALGWKIVLDESICLLKKKGKIIVRLKENAHMTVPLIKHYFGRRADINCSLEMEFYYKDDEKWILIFNIERKNYEKYLSTSWTFSILTTGKKKDNVVKFLESIRSADNYESEIIICGPQDKLYEKYGVKFLDISRFRDNYLSEISRKKNAIAEMACNDNILIAHDRFVLPKDFFSGFEIYGYDFNFLTVRQSYENGEEYPSYAYIDGRFLWGRPTQIDNLNNLYPGTYLNGGLLIFKTHVLKEMKFNKMLMWNQMEDVEVSDTFIESGLIPRINFFVDATTIGITPQYTDQFRFEVPSSLVSPWGVDNTPRIYKTQSEFVKKLQHLAIHFPKGLKKNKYYRRIVNAILAREII